MMCNYDNVSFANLYHLSKLTALYLVDQVGQVYPLHLLVQWAQENLFVRQDQWGHFVPNCLDVLLALGGPGARGDPVGHL